jgi:ABC-2 type transport system ATP-binding protein
MVTHDLLGAADVADSIGFLRDGRMLEQVTAGMGPNRFDVPALHRHYASVEMTG